MSYLITFKRPPSAGSGPPAISEIFQPVWSAMRSRMGCANCERDSITLLYVVNENRIRKRKNCSLPLAIFSSSGRPCLEDFLRLLESFLVFFGRLFSPFLSLVFGEIIEEFFVDCTTKCSLLFCRYIAFANAVIEDRVDKATVLRAPEVVSRLLTRLVQRVAGELGHQNGHWVRRADFELRFLAGSVLVILI